MKCKIPKVGQVINNSYFGNMKVLGTTLSSLLKYREDVNPDMKEIPLTVECEKGFYRKITYWYCSQYFNNIINRTFKLL